jgi:DUF4097 and DUF4098 domain-containing protein YvlB
VGLERLKVKTHNGSIAITGASGTEGITVRAVIKGGGDDDLDADACLGAIGIKTPVEDGTQLITWDWKEARKDSWQACVAFEIAVPSRLAVDAVTHNGDVRMNGMAAAAGLVTHNGSVGVGGHGGGLDVETHNGSIIAEVGGRMIKLHTHNGAIDAALQASGSVDGKIVTHNGSVNLSVGKEVSAQITAGTDNGRINLDADLETTMHKKTFLVARIGTGEGRLEIETHNGSVTIK